MARSHILIGKGKAITFGSFFKMYLSPSFADSGYPRRPSENFNMALRAAARWPRAARLASGQLFVCVSLVSLGNRQAVSPTTSDPLLSGAVLDGSKQYMTSVVLYLPG